MTTALSSPHTGTLRHRGTPVSQVKSWMPAGMLLFNVSRQEKKYFGLELRILTDLTTADGVDLRGEDADSVQGKTFEKPGGWSIVSIDVFHQLHCLVCLCLVAI